MEVIEKTLFYSRPDKFYLYPIGDIHLGVIHCDENLLETKVAEIKSQKNAYWLGMGDYADLITPDDFKRWDGKVLASWMKGNEGNIGPTQVEKVDEILSPIWDKCLGLIEGGHDDGIRRYHHYDFMVELLKKANKKQKPPWDKVPYGGVDCFVRLNFKRGRLGRAGESHDYIIHARHGEGHARTSGARALAVLRLAQTMVNAHIILMGHLHGQEAPDIPERLILTRGKIKAFEGIAVMTGAWLKGYMQDVPPSYVERWGFPPSSLGCPRIVFEPDKNKMTLEKTKTTLALG